MSAETDPADAQSRGSRALVDLLHRARFKAAQWRAGGAGADLDAVVHPPARSALLATNLKDYLASPIEMPPPPRSVRGRVIHKLVGYDRARVDHLIRYSYLLTDDLSKAICQMEIELAELRGRVGRIEEREPTTGGGPTAP